MRVRAIIANITAGTPLNVATALGFDKAIPLLATRWFVQMKHGGSGLGFVLDIAQRGATPAVSTDLIAEMNPATATLAGGSYGDTYPSSNEGGIDLSLLAIDVATTNDPVIINADIKV